MGRVADATVLAPRRSDDAIAVAMACVSPSCMPNSGQVTEKFVSSCKVGSGSHFDNRASLSIPETWLYYSVIGDIGGAKPTFFLPVSALS